MDTIPCEYHAFPDVVPDRKLYELGPDELRSRIIKHRGVTCKLKERTLHHQKAVAQYQGCLNLLVPLINLRLPRELLGEIFKLHMLTCTQRPSSHHNDDDDDDDDGDTYHPYIWIRVAHVCRHWRGIVLSHPGLFTFIRATTNRQKKHRTTLWDYLWHSQQGLLDIEGELHREPSKYSVWEYLPPKLPRLRSLQLTIAPFLAFVAEWPICPEAKKFSCTVIGDAGFPLNFPYPQGVPALEQIISHLPNLEHLSIDLSKLILALIPSISLQSLTHLAVRSAYFNYERLVETLLLSPQLQVLELTRMHTIHYLDAQLGGLPGPGFIAPTPHLRHLKLSGEFRYIEAVLQTITNVESFAVCFGVGMPSEAFLNGLRSSHSRVLSAIKSFHLRIDNFMEFVGWSSDDVSKPTTEAPIMHFVFPYPEPKNLNTLINRVTKSLFTSLGNVKTLTVACPHDLSTMNWDPFLLEASMYLTRLCSLSIPAPSGSSLQIFYSVIDALSSKSRIRIHAFPLLRELRILFACDGFGYQQLHSLQEMLLGRSRSEAVHKMDLIVLKGTSGVSTWRTNMNRDLESIRRLVGELRVIDNGIHDQLQILTRMF